jgi:hypothetical protein
MSEKKTKQTAIAKRENPIQALTVRFPEESYNLLAPTVHMAGGLPAGTRLTVTEVKINPDTRQRPGREVFPLPGGALLVGKTGLDRIANAAGVSWLEEVRKDDRQHPHYVEAFVRGRITDFDGTTREITGSKTIDLREQVGTSGLPGKDYDEIVTKAKNAKDYQTGKPAPRDPTNQLTEARKFIAEIAFSKAQNRAIASALGIKRGYSKKDLEKPFVIPKLALDTSDPAARDLAQANAAGATVAMYGAKAAATPDIVDAEFEEAPAPVTDDQIVDDTAVEAPPLGGEEHDEKTGEVADVRPPPTEDEIKQRTGSAYNHIITANKNFTNRAWQSLVTNATGKTGYDNLTWLDLEAINDAATKYVMELED